MSAALRIAREDHIERSAGPRFSEDLGGVLELYRRHGFDAGYHQAVRDQLERLVLQAEGFLAEREAGAETRKQIYAFVEGLERQLVRQSPLTAGGFVEGAGI